MNKVLRFAAASILCWAAGGQVSFADNTLKTPPAMSTEQFRIQTRMAELRAEKDGLVNIDFSPELLGSAAANPRHASLLDETRKRFTQLYQERLQKQAELANRIQSAETSIEAQQQQLTANRNRLVMVSGKLESLQPAVERGLIGENYVSALTTEVAQLSAQSDALEASIAQIKWEVAEYSLRLRKQASERSRILEAQLQALTSRKRQADRFEEKLVASETPGQLHSSMQ